MTLKEWDEAASKYKGFLPKYGGIPRTEEEKKIDMKFINAALKQDTTYRKASDDLITLGFSYLYKNDLKTAMLRFNQAYLLDSSNTDIYWGYGAIYMTLGDYERGRRQYATGLSVNPNNSHILTDFGTYYSIRYDSATVKKDKIKILDSAIIYLSRSYRLKPTAPETSIKLAACYFKQNNCDSAWKYHDICKSLNERYVKPEYTRALEAKCKR